jgi:hypothetical protein
LLRRVKENEKETEEKNEKRRMRMW